MMGFLFGSLVLIAIEVGLQPGVADKAVQGGGAVTALIKRALSPDVAGIPDKSQPKVIARKLPPPAGAGGKAKPN